MSHLACPEQETPWMLLAVAFTFFVFITADSAINATVLVRRASRCDAEVDGVLART